MNPSRKVCGEKRHHFHHKKKVEMTHKVTMGWDTWQYQLARCVEVFQRSPLPVIFSLAVESLLSWCLSK